MAKLIDAPSASSFPISAYLLGSPPPPRSTSPTTSSPPPTSKSSTSPHHHGATPSFLPNLRTVAQLLLAIVCAAAAAYTDFVLLAKALRIVNEGLPGACLKVYLAGAGMLLFVARCERLDEERCKREWRKEV